ncbi:prolyl oligopeptidase family serine peptidase [Leeuwenhoekiella sp. A16]|uniref:S9 family peptidase n=1 Tax=unclassified Leeuwenhoekiella TaxID=2615029 RepID=UPI003A8113F0
MKNFKFLLLFLLPFISVAQQDTLSMQTYKRAAAFRTTSLRNKEVFNLRTSTYWFKDNSGLWFVDYASSGKKYKKVIFKQGKVEPLFDQEALADALSNFYKKPVSADSLDIENLEKEDENLFFSIKNQQFKWNDKNGKLTEVEKKTEEDNNEMLSVSPDGNWEAFPKNHNIYIRSKETGDTIQLSTDGKPGYDYGSYYGWFDIMEGENAERPVHFGVRWSEDGKYLFTQLCDVRNAGKMYLLDYSIDSLYRPKLLSYYRGSPGDTNMVHVKPVIFDMAKKKEIQTDLPFNTHINAANVRQATDAKDVAYASYAERGFQKEHLLKIDLKTGKTTSLLTEISATNIDNFNYWPLENTGKLLFSSERSGWNQLYLLDVETKTVSPLTNGNFVVNEVKHIDQEKGIIYYTASGVSADMNLYHQQLFSVNLRGEKTLLTPEKVHHEVDFSPNGEYFTDNASTVQIPTVTTLNKASTGKQIAVLTKADVSTLAEKGWKVPEVFSLKAKDNKTTIYGALWKPTNFDPAKSYPVLDATYTGPHTQVFPKSFDRAISYQDLAELGFLIVAVDGLGTAGRSKAFKNVSYKNMGDNLRDHVLAIKYLGQQHAWVDTTRVGIFGHSAGGFDAGHAMLAFPDFYKVAVASSGDHDFRMEKAWWPEMYMGWPVDSTYNEVSNITMAGNLKGKLLLVHGGIDDNVNPSATFKFAEALIKAGKQFDMLIIPSQRHGYTGKYSDYFTKKRWNYFIKNLMGKETRWDFELE